MAAATSSSSSQPHHIIVGSGVFGTSTALTLVQAGHSVTVLDRSIDGFVAPDAASSDLNKIIRADYTDPFYRALGKEAISQWRVNPLYTPYYHETGVLFHSGRDNKASADYMLKGAHNGSIEDEAHLESTTGNQLPKVAHLIQSSQQGKECFPEATRQHLGPLFDELGDEDHPSYFNPRGGWAEARNATVAALQEAKRLGAEPVGEAEVNSFIFADDNSTKVIGVKTSDGRSFKTAHGGSLFLCAGSWTTQLLTSGILPKEATQTLGQPASTSGQTVITVQVSDSLRPSFKDLPVVFDVKTGFYVFEPDAQGVLKAAIHGPGYANPGPPVGLTGESIRYPSFSKSWTPSNPADDDHASTTAGQTEDEMMAGRNKPSEAVIQTAKEDQIPRGKAEEILELLYEVYPTLREHASNLKSRVCWYSDTLDENWILDSLPGYEGLIVATGDSGHGFKFLPTIGRYIVARLPESERPASVPALTEQQAKFWSFTHHQELHQEQARVVEQGGDCNPRQL